MAESTDEPTAALGEELRTLARARSPLGVAQGSLPSLEALAEVGVGTGDLDGVHTIIDRARSSLPRREAVAVALLFADDDARWQRNLTERMTLAGAELGFRYDTFRRRSGNHRPDSHYDRLLTLLAEAIVEVAAAGLFDDEQPAAPHDGGVDRTGDRLEPDGLGVAASRAVATPGSVPDSEKPTATAPSASGAVQDSSGSDGDREAVAGRAGASRRLLIGLAIAVGVAALAWAIVAGNDDDGSTEPGDAGGASSVAEGTDVDATDDDTEATATPDDATPGRTLDVLESEPVDGCDIPLGGSMNPVALPVGLEALVGDAFADTGGVAALGCPLRTVEVWDQLWYQEFAGAGLPPGRILADPVGGVAIWIDETMFFHYERSGGGGLQTLGGLPVATDYDDDHPRLLLSGGGAIVAHYLGGPAHWVPVEGIEAWEQLGGADGRLGLPMADVNFFDGRPGQEWSGGYGERRDDGTVAVDLVDQADIDAAVADLPRRRNGILRLYDETAYWIDDQGRRRWIPDGQTWECLGGADALIELETRGWVVGAFPPGPNAVCP